MTYLIPPNGRPSNNILPGDRICMPSQQRPLQTPHSPRLTAHRGATVILRYQENGHVTLLNNTPTKLNSGQVFVYGTEISSPKDTLLGVHRSWNMNGTGGNRRGRLLTQADFDDGKCYGPNFESPFYQQRQARFRSDPGQGPNRWCQTSVTVPCDAHSELYTLYWVWDWPSFFDGPGEQRQQKSEVYTTCIDLVIN